MNLALYGYGALAELEAALLEKGEVNKEVLGKVRHVKNTFEVCCVNSEAKDFVSYGWILARDYAWKVENKVEQGITNWQGMPVGVQTSDLVLAQCEVKLYFRGLLELEFQILIFGTRIPNIYFWNWTSISKFIIQIIDVLFQICMYAIMQVCMYASMHVCKYAFMQLCIYAIMHEGKYVFM